jgi:hypothetical protein
MSEYKCEKECIFNTEEDYIAFTERFSWEEIKLLSKFLETPKKYPAILTYGISYDEHSGYDGHYTYPEDVEKEKKRILRERADFLTSFIKHLEEKHGYSVTVKCITYQDYYDIDAFRIKEIAEKFVGLE